MVVVVPVIEGEGSVAEVRVKEVVDWVVGTMGRVEAGLVEEAPAMEVVSSVMEVRVKEVVGSVAVDVVKVVEDLEVVVQVMVEAG